MQITESFEVHSEPDAAWKLFQDIAELAQCLPGAELKEERGGGEYAGSVVAKFGPITLTFEGDAKVTADQAAHTGTVDAKGADKRGGSSGSVKVDYRIEPSPAGTRVNVDADVVLRGQAAQFGRTGLIQEMAHRIVGEFVDCIEAKLAAETAEDAAQIQAGALKGFSLFLSSLVAPIARLFRRIFRRSGH